MSCWDPPPPPCCTLTCPSSGPGTRGSVRAPGDSIPFLMWGHWPRALAAPSLLCCPWLMRMDSRGRVLRCGLALRTCALQGVTAVTFVFLCLFQEVRSTTVAFLLLRIPTLKIKVASKKETFEANLKTECDLWHLLVKEMWAGRKLADDHKVWGLGLPFLLAQSSSRRTPAPVVMLSPWCSGNLGVLGAE